MLTPQLQDTRMNGGVASRSLSAAAVIVRCGRLVGLSPLLHQLLDRAWHEPQLAGNGRRLLAASPAAEDGLTNREGKSAWHERDLR